MRAARRRPEARGAACRRRGPHARRPGRVAVAERNRLQRAARLVERAPDCPRRRRPASRGANARIRPAERRERLRGDRDRIAIVRGDHRAKQCSLAGSRCRDQRRDSLCRQCRLQRRLAGVGIVERKQQHPELAPDSEWPQPARQLLGVEAATERLGEHVPGKAALGLADDPLAHQLQRNDHRRPARHKPLEVVESAALGGDGQPADRRPPRPTGDGDAQGAAGKRLRARLEEADHGAGPALRNLGAKPGEYLGCRPPAGRRDRDLDATRVLENREAPRRAGDRAHDLVEATALDHQALELLVDPGVPPQDVVLLVPVARTPAR